MLDHATCFRLDVDDVLRWAAIGKRLDAVTKVVSAEIVDLYRDPCQRRLYRCAKAARFAAEIAEEPERTIAVALAEDFERAVGRGALNG